MTEYDLTARTDLCFLCEKKAELDYIIILRDQSIQAICYECKTELYKHE